jgi:hypothetical protein
MSLDLVSKVMDDRLHGNRQPCGNSHLSNDDQDISLRHKFRACERCMESGTPKCDVDERISSQDQYQELRRSCDMMVDEASSHCFVHLCIYPPIQLLHEKALQYVKSYNEVVDEYDADYEGTERCQSGNRLQGDLGDMRSILMRVYHQCKAARVIHGTRCQIQSRVHGGGWKGTYEKGLWRPKESRRALTRLCQGQTWLNGQSIV